MQEVRYIGLPKCNNDCFNCIYEDCIYSDNEKTEDVKLKNCSYQKRYRETHVKEISAKAKEWYSKPENRQKRIEYCRLRREKEKKVRMSRCAYCHGTTSDKLYKFHKQYYCSVDCISKHLLEKAEKEIYEVAK